MNYLIFGGAGFIGTHLAKFVNQRTSVGDHIYSLDIDDQISNFAEYVKLDVRQPITVKIPDVHSSVIFNLAAVHATPGHPDNEYFETNILGAQNICDFARINSINTIVFTSSIAPYGPSEDIKTEDTMPMPQTPYGISKLTAEYIHKVWQAEAPTIRKLIIVRPGVVFGKDEGENFTRLYNALKKRFFFYPGRKNTVKAAVYVKDVVRILFDTAMSEPAGVNTFNLTYFPAPTIEIICKTISEVTKTKEPKIVISPNSLKVTASIMYSSARLLGVKINGIHPDRVKKLMISTNVSGEKLFNSKYKLQYSLNEAITDWFNDCNKEGLY